MQGSNALIKAGATPVTEPKDILDYFGIETKSKEKVFLKAENELENKILRALQKEKLTVEEMLENTKIAFPDLNKNLARLVIKGIIKESSGKYYI